jgi:hypothetical protein
MHQEIEKLIDLALADGQVTEKERNVILKKASELGVDIAEVEMTIDAKKHLHERNTVGSQIKCPSCGNKLSGLIKICTCGYVLNTGSINETKSLDASIETLENLIIQLRSIGSFSSKEVIESLTARVEKEIRFIKTRYSENLEVKRLLLELETLSEKHIQRAFKRAKFKKIVTVFALAIGIFISVVYVLYNKAQSKTSSEKLIEYINEKYLENYLTYRSSNQYKIDSTNFQKLFIEIRLMNNFTNKNVADSISNIFSGWLKSHKNIDEFYYFGKARECELTNRDFEKAKLYIDSSLVLNPDFSPTYWRLYNILSQNKDEAALDALNKAISIEKTYSYLYLKERAIFYFLEKRDNQRAIEDIYFFCDKYPKNQKKDIEILTYKIQILYNLNRKHEACQEFHKLNKNEKEEIKNNILDAYEELNKLCMKI